MRTGNYDAAIATFKEFVDGKDPALPAEALLMELARAYTAAGKTEDARKTLNQIVEQHGTTPFADEAKQELEKLKS
jgi:FimV-like protein